MLPMTIGLADYEYDKATGRATKQAIFDLPCRAWLAMCDHVVNTAHALTPREDNDDVADIVLGDSHNVSLRAATWTAVRGIMGWASYGSARAIMHGHPRAYSVPLSALHNIYLVLTQMAVHPNTRLSFRVTWRWIARWQESETALDLAFKDDFHSEKFVTSPYYCGSSWLNLWNDNSLHTGFRLHYQPGNMFYLPRQAFREQWVYEDSAKVAEYFLNDKPSEALWHLLRRRTPQWGPAMHMVAQQWPCATVEVSSHGGHLGSWLLVSTTGCNPSRHLLLT